MAGTKLDADQVLKLVYDETEKALKTTGSGGGPGNGLTNTELRASPLDINVLTNPPTTVVIDSNDDSIAIGDRDTGDLLKVNPDGSALVSTMNQLVPENFNGVFITSKNGNGDPLIVQYKQGLTIVATLTLSYDIDGDLESVVKS